MNLTPGMEITVISGDFDKVGCIVEIPRSNGSLGTGPIYEIDPRLRKCKNTLQRFEITAIHADGTRDLKPVTRAVGR